MWILGSTIGVVCGEYKKLSTRIIHLSIRCTLKKPKQIDPSTFGATSRQSPMNQVTSNILTDCLIDQLSMYSIHSSIRHLCSKLSTFFWSRCCLFLYRSVWIDQSDLEPISRQVTVNLATSNMFHRIGPRLVQIPLLRVISVFLCQR